MSNATLLALKHQLEATVRHMKDQGFIVGDAPSYVQRGLSLKAIREDRRECDFVASTDAIDSYDEIVDQSWDLERYTKNPVILFAHNSRALPIGQAVSCGVMGNQLLCTVRFASEVANPLAENCWQLILEGCLRAVSVGFMPRDVRYEKRDGREVYVLANNELHEISVVPVPANPEALLRMRESAKAKATTVRVERVASAAPIDALLTTLAAPLAGPDGQPLPPPPAAARDEAPGEIERAAITSPAAAGETTKETEMKTIEELTAAVAQRDAKITVLEGDQTRAVKAAEERIATLEKERGILEKQNAQLVTEREAAVTRANEAEGRSLKMEIEGLIGVKIDPAEADDFTELARTNRPLFERMIAQRAEKPLLQRVAKNDPAPPTPATAPGTAQRLDLVAAAAAVTPPPAAS